MHLTRDQRLMALSGVLWGFGMSLFLYIHPLYIEYLGATPEQIGLALGLSGLVVTVAYIPVGLWADRRGRKPVIVAGWALATVATLGVALAPDWRWFTPAWALYLLSNFAMPAFHGYIAASQPAGGLGNLSRVFALISSGSSIGSILSPAVGGWMGEQFGLRAVYLAAAFFAALSTLVLTQLRSQPPGRNLATPAARTLVLDGRFLWHVLFIFLLFTALELSQVMTPKFLQDVRGWSVSQVGLMGTISALGIVLLGLIVSYLPQEGRGALLLSQALSLLAVVLWVLAPNPLLIAVAYFVHGSNRVHRPLVLGQLARRLDAGTMSLGYGFMQTALQLGWSVAPYLAGRLYASNPYWPYLGGLLGLGLTMLLTFSLPLGRLARRPEPVEALEHSEA